MINVHVYPSSLTHESRILRITQSLAEAGLFRRIEVIGVFSEGLSATEDIDEHRRLHRLERRLSKLGGSLPAKLAGMIEWSIRVLLWSKNKPVQCINAHSLSVLPICFLVSRVKGAKLVYEPHELETETRGSTGLRRAVAREVEKWLVRRCDLVFVVSNSIANWYATRFGINTPAVVRNVPSLQHQRMVDRTALRRRIGLRDGTVVFMHMGGLMEGRGIERMIRVFSSLVDIDLLFMGHGALVELVQDAARSHANIHYIPSVPTNEVIMYARVADAGLCLTEPECLSHEYSLPNKLFEYLHAGLPVVVNPLKEQRRVITDFNCGWIAPASDQAFSNLLRSIDKETIRSRQEGVRRAAEEFCWDLERLRLLEAYRNAALA